MDSAERQVGATDAAEATAAPVLEQRLSPWLTLRTTVKEQGLVVQVARPFKERVNAVGFERLLLVPAEVSFVRTDRLWFAGALAVAGLALSWPGLSGLPALAGLLHSLSALLGPGLLAAAVLVLLLAVADPRRVSVFLDREQGLHPKVVRGAADEAQAAEFVETVKRAIVTHRCSGPTEEAAEAEGEADGDGGGSAAAAPSLADTIDALLVMRQHGLLDEQEFTRFREFAERR